MILFIKHIEIEGPETLGVHFEEAGFQIETVDLHKDGKLPQTLKGLQAVVSLGGPMNVYEEDKYPFLRDENILIQQVVAAGLPFLGICLGSQLLAKATGGKVVRSPKPEVGWSTIDITEDGRKDALLAGLPSPLEVYQWHGDMCVPRRGSVTLATAKDCPMQAFRVGSNAYGLQFHAEITDKSIDEWSRAYTPKKHKARADMLKRYQDIEESFQESGRMLCRNFVSIIRRSR